MKALTRYHVAEKSLAAARTINEVTEIYSYYDGMARTARKLHDRAAEIEAAEFVMRAKRKLGIMMGAARKAGALAKIGRPGKKRVKKNPISQPTLFDVGIDKNLAHSARRFSSISEQDFQDRMALWRRQINGGNERISTKLPRPVRERSTKTRTQNLPLKEWERLSAEERRAFLTPENFQTGAQFNKQETAGIEWAQWSWNVLVGCRHDCPYCYARDITERYPDAFPHVFEPVFRPHMLNAPTNTRVPDQAAADTRYKNVFVGSMTDMFGRWVPAEIIEAVLKAVHDNKQWNFLFLTKYPKRMSEFDIPANAWMGTTVDLQARVGNAEAAFAKLAEKYPKNIRWLSLEPLLEPLRFQRLNLFHWVVVGGASKSSKTPAFHPPFPWIMDIYVQAKAAGCCVYMKTNLLGNRVLELPFDAPIKTGPKLAPDVFNYLGRSKDAER